MPSGKISSGQKSPGMAGVLERNIRALLHKRQQQEDAKNKEEYVADRITAFAGSMRFVYLHAVVFGLWIMNSLHLTPFAPFDPDFVKLATTASVEAIFLSTFVLISQNRMSSAADKRAELDLQISLLSEHEITRLIKLVDDIANRMKIETHKYSELDELKNDIHPGQVLDQIEEVSNKESYEYKP